MLSPGTNLGPYEIVAPLGAGGMGEVYRARDTRLDRTVAIKILPQEMSRDPLRKQRFEREAKTISSLNHPHICVLHDVGSQDGLSYLVMECLEGETLAKRLEKGPLPLEQVLKYGAQIADALDKAHRSGVVHRDLKPGNIMLTPSGAKLLDFGLAKPVAALTSVATLTAAVTESSPMTEQGAIVGTFQYMSPEQVEGKELDGRSDIFSLGAVLYEMLTGKRAFEGKSQLSVASAILEKEPAPISTIKPLTPPALDHAIRRCLAKDPDERWQMARDLGLELKWISESGSQAATPVPQVSSRRNRERVAWAVAAFLAVTGLGAFFANQQFAKPSLAVMVSDLAAPKGTKYNSLVNGRPAISPDGHAVVFSARDASGRSSLWVRVLDGSPAQPIPGTESAGAAFWSPDGRRIGFVQNRQLVVVDAAGGPAVTLVDGLLNGGGSWGRNGMIMFGREGIYQIPTAGGSAALVVPRSAQYSGFLAPTVLPDGKHFLYRAVNTGFQGDLFWASIDGKENHLLLRGTGHAEYASGHLLYARGASLVAQPFEPETGQLTGAEHVIVEQVQQGLFTALFSVSQNGMLIYEPASRAPAETQLAWYDRSGKRLASIGVPGFYPDLRLSPDARRLASSVGAPRSEMWVDDLDRGVRMRLTFDPDTDNGIPVWSPDGSILLFSTLLGSKAGVGIFKKPSNGSGNLEMLLPSDRPDREAWATDWSRDGRFVLFSRGGMVNSSDADIWVLPMIGEKKPTVLVHAAATASDAQFSPDGRWVAYTSRESGRNEVYVVSFDAAKVLNGAAGNAAGGKWLVSAGGGYVPRWRRDGKELFYIEPGGNIMMAVEVDGKGASFNVGRSQRLFVAPVNPIGGTYDVTPDGQKFVMGAPPEEDEPPLVLMQNWTARLEKK